MVISSVPVAGHSPSPYDETLDGQSSVISPTRAILPSNLDAISSLSTITPSSDKTLDEHLLSSHDQVRTDLGLDSELSNSNGVSSSAKVVSKVPEENWYDPMENLEEQLREDVLQFLDQSLDDTPNDTRDYDSVVSSDGCESSHDEPLDVADTPIGYEGDKDERKSAMEIEPKEKPSHLPVSWEHNTFYRSCICNRYGRPSGPGWLLNSPCGPECKYNTRDFGSWEPLGNDWDDRPPSFSIPAETGIGAGLYNLGNTCFLNAILQCFTHTVPLVKALRSSNHLMSCRRGLEGFCVLCALCNHVERSLASSGKIISPSQIVDNLNKISSCFHRYQQEDAHEFLQCLLDKLERCSLDSTLEEDNLSSLDDSIVQRVFGGRLVSKLRCCKCGHCSDKYEPLIDLSLEIEDADTLHHALESFTKVEKIEDSEAKIKCDNCKEEVSMEKQLMLEQAPSVAALHLKRFKTDGSSIEKIRKPVDFPLELDLKPYSKVNENNNDDQEHLKYQLYAVVVHNGISPTSGHYFCYVRSSPSIWHKLDDSVVVRVEEEMVLSKAAYILFYVREDAPWFSSMMEKQKDPITSPKSVLDRVESKCTAYPRVENSYICKKVVNSGDIDRTPLPCVPMVDDDKMNQDGINSDEITAHISEVCGDKSRADVPVNVNSLSIAVEAKNCHDDKLGVLHSQEINNRFQKNDAINPLMPPSSPITEIYVKPQPESRHKMRGDRLIVEASAVNEKKLKRNRDEFERREAARYLQKNASSSRCMKLLAAMAPRNDKKRRLRMSPCKQGSPPGSRSKLMRRHHVLH